MTDVHARIHAVKQEESRTYQYDGSDKAKPFDPTKPVADMITKENWLICFDEFQVNDLPLILFVGNVYDFLGYRWWTLLMP